MRLLLDTCTFLWLTVGSTRLTDAAKSAIRNPENDVYLSAASAWGIAVKWRLGKLKLDRRPEAFIAAERERHGVEELPIRESAALLSASLPDVHRDPFDRMLVSQAIDGGLSIVSPDPAFDGYPVKLLW